MVCFSRALQVCSGLRVAGCLVCLHSTASYALLQVHPCGRHRPSGPALGRWGRCLWCSATRSFHRPRRFATRGGDGPVPCVSPSFSSVLGRVIPFVSGHRCIASSRSPFSTMASSNDPPRDRSRSRSVRRLVSPCDTCSSCAFNRGLLLRILHLLQERDRPASVGSGRPSLDLSEVFTGSLEQATVLMGQPRISALAVRHLESRCDAIVRSLDSSIQGRRG